MNKSEFHFAIGHIDWTVLAGLLGSALLAYIAHFVAFAIVRRISQRTATSGDDEMVRALYQPSRWLLILLVLMAGVEAARVEPVIEGWWRIASAMALAALAGWGAMRVLAAVRHIVEERNDITADNNLMARRRTTRVRILNRVAQTVILFLTIAFMLLAIPAVRTIGVTLVASAGLAALAVGAAAQPALKNLIAGIQMAFTEPIRLDDVVIVEGEWGRIEDIRLTYVVLRIWDDRRLVVPVSYFLENVFQNWTRQTSDLLGTIYFHVDHAADIGRIRESFLRIVEANANWDGRTAGLVVTGQTAEATELRGLVSAANSSLAWDLRCEVREAMIDFMRREMPEALVRSRAKLEGEAGGEPLPMIQSARRT